MHSLTFHHNFRNKYTEYNIHIKLEKIHIPQYHMIKNQSALRSQCIIRYSRNDRSSSHPLGVA
jgi:hypothetical protein